MAKGDFYAVAAGRSPGIFTTWSECEAQVKGFNGSRYKKFKTNAEAQSFIDDYNRQHGAIPKIANRDGQAAHVTNDIDPLIQQFESMEIKPEKKEVGVDDLRRLHGENLVAFCFGSAPLNGQDGCTAAFAVSFPLEDAPTRSRPVTIDPTNNRADCLAAEAATSIANELDPKKQRGLVIYSRYQNLIRAMSAHNGSPRWINTWQDNGWKNAKGKPVAHLEIYESLLRAEELRAISWVFLDETNHPKWMMKLHQQTQDVAKEVARSDTAYAA